MKIHKVITSVELNVDDFVMLMAAANAAGYMEERGKIVIEDDADMALAILEMYNAWLDDNKQCAFLDYATSKLIDKFAADDVTVEE